MAWIDSKAFWFFLPALTDVFIWGKSPQGFKSFSEIVGHQEGVEVLLEVLMRLIVIFFDRGFFEGAVHALDLAISPGMIGFGEAVLDPVLLTHARKDMLEGILIPLAIGALHAIVRQDRVNFIGHGVDEAAQKLRRDGLQGLRVQLSIGKLAGAVNGDE